MSYWCKHQSCSKCIICTWSGERMHNSNGTLSMAYIKIGLYRYSAWYTERVSGAQTHSKAAGIRETGRHDWTWTHRAAKGTGSRSAPNKTNYRRKQRLLDSPLLEASPPERSLDWRPEKLETDWPKTPPYSGTAGGKQPIWDNTKLDQQSPCRGPLTQGMWPVAFNNLQCLM